MKNRSTKQFLREIKRDYKIKGKDLEVANLLFIRYLRTYENRGQAEQKTITEIKKYINYRNNKKNNREEKK